MKTCNLKTLIAVVCVAAGLAGCDRTPEQPKPAPAPAKISKIPQAQPASEPRADAPTTKELLAYYSAHLKEAQTVWHECLAKGLKNISEEEKPRCVAAQNAWQNQPYKPKTGGTK